MLLSDHYPKSIHKDNGTNYEVLIPGKNQRSKFLVRCITCSDECHVTAASILSGRLPCQCGLNKYKTSESKVARILPILKDKNIELLSLEIESAKSPITVRCLVCQQDWVSSYNSLCLQDRGCHFCNGTYKKNEEDLIASLKENLSNKDCSLIELKYSTGYSKNLKVKVLCNTCENLWETSVASIQKGCGCPKCAKYGFQTALPAMLYLLRVVSENSYIIGYKYGITLNLDQRIRQHNKECKFLNITFEPSYLWSYESGLTAKLHEKNIKNSFPKFFEKYQLPSGFTETISPEMFGELVDFQTEQYNRSKTWQE